ncbi:MAG: glucose-6-phosphate isomerase [Bacteroidetes bacterium]|nr:glucose-6-phosphate isomerase [Bacteroidota bacterium]
MKTDTPAFANLQAEAERLSAVHLADLLGDDVRARALVWQMDDLRVDLSRQLLTPSTMSDLLSLAQTCSLEAKIKALFAGDRINFSENRPVVHMAQRGQQRINSAEFKRLCDFAENIRRRAGAGDIRDVINIGIGGSDLGPAMVSAALAYLADGPRIHYVSNVDPSHLHDVLLGCEAANTLVIVTSKTFTTAETLRNAALARGWLGSDGAGMVAVTAASDIAADWGIAADRIFDFDEGVGGRYSLWSAVGLPVMIGLGSAQFTRLLEGGAAMDAHFRDTPATMNLPVILGLLRVWNRNFLGLPTHGIMPYDQRLWMLPSWAQQLEMESNGKSVNTAGSPLDYATTPVIWGAAGTGAQHSFFQSLHQGHDIVPLDILLPLTPAGLSLDKNSSDQDWQSSHRVLAANAVAQAEALAVGSPNVGEPHRHFPGGRPSSIISWTVSDAFSIGRLLALYEHVTIASGFIWDVNSFDQWGVELGKAMAKQVEAVMAGSAPATGLSATATDLLASIAAPSPPQKR